MRRLIRRVMLVVVGLLFDVTAVYLFLYLLGHHDLLILASVAPAIIAAFVLGIIFILRVFERRPAEENQASPEREEPE